MTRRLCVITGASSGLGRQYALDFSSRGYDLLIIARREELLEQLSEETGGAEICVADLSKFDEVSRVCRQLGALDQIDVLINNAGFGKVEQIKDAKPEILEDMCKLNMIAPILLARSVIPGMVRNKSGIIVNVSSVISFQPSPGMACYAATKAFLTSISVALNEELRGTGVKVFTQCPGPVSTEFHLAAGLKEKIAVLDAANVRDVSGHLLENIRGSGKVIIPGTRNRLLSILSKFLPVSVSTRIMGKVLGKYTA